jgi:hypothetical protein
LGGRKVVDGNSLDCGYIADVDSATDWKGVASVVFDFDFAGDGNGAVNSLRGRKVGNSDVAAGAATTTAESVVQNNLQLVSRQAELSALPKSEAGGVGCLGAENLKGATSLVKLGVKKGDISLKVDYVRELPKFVRTGHLHVTLVGWAWGESVSSENIHAVLQ